MLGYIEADFNELTHGYSRNTGSYSVVADDLALPTGQRTRYAYDPAGRVTQVRYGDGSTESYAYRADGALLAATNDTIRIEFTCDGGVGWCRSGRGRTRSAAPMMGWATGQP